MDTDWYHEMMATRYYRLGDDRVPVEVSADEWKNSSSRTNVEVAQTKLESRGVIATISTMFTGLDHSHGGGPPMVFGTWILSNQPELHEKEWRYSTWEDAQKGHMTAYKYTMEWIAEHK